ncbi:hypothetical protein L6452_09898 [Arctium lappa]|uniref:Uncharacterized protein n=1 Tax=Arctium lappa TaxID=4217 RepID=A0ACB9DLV5_ARCLA|nr:hypothetical protein L6452_09898 [Arctium lappa]
MGGEGRMVEVVVTKGISRGRGCPRWNGRGNLPKETALRSCPMCSTCGGSGVDRFALKSYVSQEGAGVKDSAHQGQRRGSDVTRKSYWVIGDVHSVVDEVVIGSD